VKYVPTPSCHTRAISLLVVMHLTPLIQSVAKFWRMVNLFRQVGLSFFFCPSSQSNFSCSHSSFYDWMSSFTLGPDLLASMKLSMSSSSLFDAFPLLISRLESTELSSLSNPLPPSLSPTGDGLREEGRCKEGPDDGTINGT
jgi:hypothetical protein